jgi:hypothetical protein
MLPFWAEVLLSSTTSCMQMTVEYEYKEAVDEIELAFESSRYIISKLCLPLYFHYYVSESPLYAKLFKWVNLKCMVPWVSLRVSARDSDSNTSVTFKS